ncbi:MAG TPA: hypothetical protein VG206_18105 [Terriglobia bacterium]|nr:hypothetical protein [Terriglobia bacterium]
MPIFDRRFSIENFQYPPSSLDLREFRFSNFDLRVSIFDGKVVTSV